MPQPLKPIALGLVIVWLAAPVRGFDVLANPLGWLIIVGALTALPRADSSRRLWIATLVALAVSLPLAVPGWIQAIDDTDPSLGWAVSLPQAVAVILVIQVLVELSERAGDTRASSGLALTRTALLMLAVVPVVVLGAGLDDWASAASVLAGLAALAVLVQLLLYSARAWARPGPDMGQSTTNPAESS